MFKNIKEACGQIFGDLRVDRKLIERVASHVMDVVTRPGGNGEFFSGHLFGTVFISYSEKDVYHVISGIFKTNPADIKPALAKVQDMTKVDRAVRDEMNITVAYVLHLIYNSRMSNEDKKWCAIQMHMLFNIKTMCWLVTDRLKFTCSESVARKAYESTSNRFLIKRLGSWYETMVHRSECLASKDSLHIDALTDFTVDKAVVYYITNCIGTVSSRIKHSYNEMDIASKSKESIVSNSMTVAGFDGSPELATRQLSSEKSRRAIDSIIADRRSFVKEEWLQAAIRINTGTTHKALKGIVSWMSDNRYGDLGKDIQSMVCNSSIVLAQSLIKPEYTRMTNKSMRSTLLLLRGFYGASRSTSQNLIDLRAAGQRVVSGSRVHIAPSSIASTRCSVFIYMCLAALSGG